MRCRLSAISHPGKVRPRNEDRILCCPDLSLPTFLQDCHDQSTELSGAGMAVAVADGMGGHSAGDVAAREAIVSLEEYLTKTLLPQEHSSTTQKYLTDALAEANQRLVQYGSSHPDARGLGTTIVLAYLTRTKLHVAWVGDSRCYLHTPGSGIRLLTTDHTRAWEAYERGEIGRFQVDDHPESHVLTQFIGDHQLLLRPGYTSSPISPWQRLLLCSDGLNVHLTDDEIGRRLAAAYKSSDCLSALLEDTLSAGGSDNISIILVEWTIEKGGRQ